MVLDDGFGASLIDGVWVENRLFSADELKDEFRRVRDSAEAAALVSAARKAVSSTPVRA